MQDWVGRQRRFVSDNVWNQSVTVQVVIAFVVEVVGQFEDSLLIYYDLNVRQLGTVNSVADFVVLESVSIADNLEVAWS